jgi:hypothetical protein
MIVFPFERFPAERRVITRRRDPWASIHLSKRGSFDPALLGRQAVASRTRLTARTPNEAIVIQRPPAAGEPRKFATARSRASSASITAAVAPIELMLATMGPLQHAPLFSEEAT